MEKTFHIELPNAATDWGDILEQRMLEKITTRLSTPRSWSIEEIVEADRAGWIATAKDGATELGLSLAMPASKTKAPPPGAIEWTLVAEAHVKAKDKLGSALFAAIVLGTGAISGAVTWHLQSASGARRMFLSVLATCVGFFPVGLILAIVLLRQWAVKRSRSSVVPGGNAFMDEVAATVDDLKRES
jgi:hypothetical protein